MKRSEINDVCLQGYFILNKEKDIGLSVVSLNHTYQIDMAMLMFPINSNLELSKEERSKVAKIVDLMTKWNNDQIDYVTLKEEFEKLCTEKT